MSRLVQICCILMFLMFAYGCERGHHVVISHYSYADSAEYNDKRNEYDLKLSSDVRIDLLTTHSEDVREQKIVNNINNFIKSQLTETNDIEEGDSLVRYIVRSYLDEMKDMTLSRFFDANEDYSEEEDTMMRYGEELECTFFNNVSSECHFGLGDSIVCFTGTTTCYLGGAHPGEESFAYSFSLNDGSMVRVGTLLRKDCKSEMLDRIKRRLMNINHVATEEELAGLGFKDIFVSPNILLEKDSVTFHYKNYTIAPFYLGAINIRFSYEELKDILSIDF